MDQQGRVDIPGDGEGQLGEAAARPRRRRRRIARIGGTLAGLAIGLLAVRSSLIGVYTIAAACDAPTLVRGDRVLIDKAAYDWRIPFWGRRVARHGEPKRGDLVLCRVPGQEGLLVKRLVGVSGDVIELRDYQLSINGAQATYEALNPADFADIARRNRTGDRFAIERIAGVTRVVSYDSAGSLVSHFGPFTVPAGQVFLLGDNRDNSYDSRDPACGGVPRDWLLGRVIRQWRTGP